MDTETNTPEKEDPPSVASKKPSTSFAGKRRLLLVSSQLLPQGQSTDPEKSNGNAGEKVTPIVEDLAEPEMRGSREKPSLKANKKITSDENLQKRTIIYQRKPAFLFLGFLLIIFGCILYGSISIQFPPDFWDHKFEIRWFVLSGVETVNNDIRFKTTRIQSEIGDVLTKLALDTDHSFFEQIPANEIISIRDYPEGENFRAKLFALNEYRDLAINLWNFEVVPNSRLRNGYFAAISSVVIGLILIQLSGRKPAVSIICVS